MEKSNQKIRLSNGTELAVEHNLPKQDAKGLICIVHGFGEHQKRYAHVAEKFVDNGFAVTSYDQQGHGQSSGKRGHVSNYDYLLDALSSVIQQAKEVHAAIPVLLYGHSFGGNVVLNYLIQRGSEGLTGAIVTSPWLRLAFEPPAWKVTMAKLMNKLMPKFTENADIDTHELSNDTAVGEAYANDPLVHGKMTARMYSLVVEAGLYALANASKVDVPLLLTHGSSDNVTSSEATQTFAAKSGKLVTLKIWEGAKHETHNEVNKDEVISHSIGWVSALLVR